MRIEPLVEAGQRCSLAGAVDASEQDKHRKLLLFDKVELRFEQLLAEFRLLALERLLVDLVLLLGGLEHWFRSFLPRAGSMAQATMRSHSQA